MTNEIVQKRLATAKGLLHEIDVNMQFQFWNSTVNRMYYACFHAVRALLYHLGIEDVKKHSGTRHMFNQHVILPGLMSKEWSQFYAVIFDCRSSADYEDEQEYDKETVEELYPKVKEFVALIEKIITTSGVSQA